MKIYGHFITFMASVLAPCVCVCEQSVRMVMLRLTAFINYKLGHTQRQSIQHHQQCAMCV